MRFLGISSVILFIGLFISLFASSSVNAQSAYDNTISTVDKIYLTTGDNWEIDENIDVTLTLGQVIQSNCSTGQYNYFRDVTSNYNNGSRWAIVQGYGVGFNVGSKSVSFVTNKIDDGIPDSQNYDTNAIGKFSGAEFDEPQLYIDTNEQLSSLVISIGRDGDIVCSYDTDLTIASYLAWDNPPTHYKRPFLNLFDIIYPENYQGGTIPDDYEVKDPTLLAPNYNLTVQADGKFRFVVNHFLAFGGGFRVGDLKGNSNVTYCEIDSYEDYGCLGSEGYDWVYSQSPVASTFREGTLPEAGYYKFYVDNSSVTAPVPPFPADLSPYQILDRRILVYWDGFSILEVNTLGNNDSEEVRSDENNISNKFFDMLDVPTFGLTDIVVLPLAFISNLDDMECQPVILPLPNNIGNLQLPCMTEEVYEPNFSGILTIYQTIMIGLFSYYIALRMFGNIKELSNPKDDRIEVAKL